jgi:hypothetical protein
MPVTGATKSSQYPPRAYASYETAANSAISPALATATHSGRSQAERSATARQAAASTARLRPSGGGSRVRRDRSVSMMLAWISTPAMRPTGVG